MSHEIHDGAQPAAADNAASTNLSNHVFSSPQEFLQVLKDNFDKIDTDSSNGLTRDELQAYSVHGADPKSRAAAKLMYDHYDQFLDNASLILEDSHDQPGNSHVTRALLNMEIAQAGGDDSLAVKMRTEDVSAKERAALGFAVGGVLGGTAMLEAPPGALILYGAAVGSLALAYHEHGQIAKVKEAVDQQIYQNQQTISGWL